MTKIDVFKNALADMRAEGFNPYPKCLRLQVPQAREILAAGLRYYLGDDAKWLPCYDVANAVREGCDSTMLSGETAAGKYPETCVYYMANIQKRMMPEMDYEKLFNNAVEGHDDTFVSAFAMDAAKMAMEYKNVAAIITIGGKDMARAVSKFRPAAPIIATVPQTRDARALALNYAVYPVLGNEKDAISFINKNIEDVKGKVAIVVSEDSIKIVNL